MPDYIVEPKSRRDLRRLARLLRRKLQIDDKLWIPIVEVLDILAEILPDFSYEIVPDSALPRGAHAETDIVTGHIRIKETVYERACDGKGRDRMTIAHEIGHHFTLRFCGFRLYRNFRRRRVKAFNDPEWQAKCFAGEFMIGHHLTGAMSPREIVRRCGVSLDAAEYQHSHHLKSFCESVWQIKLEKCGKA